MKQGPVIVCFFIAIFCNWSCKKGPDDPSFTFKSRVKRICADWKMQSGSMAVKSVDASGATIETTYKLDGKRYSADIIGKGTIEGNYSLSLSVKDNGSFSYNETADAEQYTIKGRWDFLGKQDDYKKRERVLFDLATAGINPYHLVSFNKGNNAFAYSLRELSKDKMVMDCMDEFITSPDGSTNYFITSSFVFVH